ncbi:D-tagatose-1,6-bisphosphate aldolase subunit GatZ/KbaZ [Hephaestia caeni]|uniref:D-tagatose-1,6-bisphosphate aldolase subunit GatZ/KbaZ n=1 Tax=Hephaestia caeni TaxID=645617 RepID=A0A397NNJ8_9SPHN|nr:D-tagatose-bisphosphate aldolase, class II, non-catalytic subunit [Hephaestia caeni]RIA37173.1 D-tagatose-1,6-bisphosphate aldolase subunit GatZ/KbaZ [Hephaestia caeni]
MQAIRALVTRHKSGERVGITSICSAHPLVIEATFVHALRHDLPIVLIEATSNQVNQDGGYTGMVPAAFRSFVEGIAARVGFPLDRLVLGGDHLGPNAWTALPAEAAMAKAEIMVADYVRAGFRKIHLDCSMSCADDPVPLPEHLIADRAARLCRAAEQAFDGAPDDAPVYVIGTEVPVPGGAAEDLDELAVTTPEAALATVTMHRDLFHERGLGAAWDRVVATVVQPGVEFDHDKVVDYRPEKARALSTAIEPVDHIVFEAHSTDYQPPQALAALVRDHFAVLKVGPGVTFALREALWALDAIEAEWIADGRAAMREVTLARMKADPANWRKYYHEQGRALDLQLQYSLSDRIRYYWPDPAIVAAQQTLFANLRRSPPPMGLVSQYLPAAFAAVRRDDIATDPAALVIAHIGITLDAYYGACYPHV